MPTRKRRAVCAGEGGLVDPDQLTTVDGIRLHKVGDEYHRVADGVRVLVQDGKVVDIFPEPIDPAAAIRY